MTLSIDLPLTLALLVLLAIAWQLADMTVRLKVHWAAFSVALMALVHARRRLGGWPARDAYMAILSGFHDWVDPHRTGRWLDDWTCHHANVRTYVWQVWHPDAIRKGNRGPEGQ